MPATTKPKARTEVIAWIDRILQDKRWTGTDLARKAGLAPSTILRMLNDPAHQFTPTLKTLKRIAEAAGGKIPATIVAAMEEIETERGEGRSAQRRPAFHRTKQPMVPVRTKSSLPSALRPDEEQDVYVPCPPQLEGDATAFAFYLADNALEPWIKPGALMYATKRRDPVPGDVVVATRTNGVSVVRLLLEINESGVVLSKSHPPVADLEVSFDDLSELAVVSMTIYN